MIRGMPTQEMDTSARSPSRETALAKPNTAPTCRQPHQTIRRSQRLDGGGGGQALNGQQGRTEEPQQDHVEGNSQNTSLLVKASSTEAGEQTDANLRGKGTAGGTTAHSTPHSCGLSWV